MSDRSSLESASHPGASALPAVVAADDEPDDSYLPATFHRRREDSTSSAILEALPLLGRPSIYIDRTSNASLGTGRGPTYGSDDGGDPLEGHQLVRVQSGVKRVEAITMLWTKRSLIIAYTRYAHPLQQLLTGQHLLDCDRDVPGQQHDTGLSTLRHLQF